MSRGATTARGYGTDHEQIRAALTPLVESGRANCCETICLEVADGRTRKIEPGSDWHLAHTDDRTGYKGPAHARCNMSEGGRRGNPRTKKPPARSWRPTRIW